MNSLERLDKKKSQMCKDLSVKDKLRTGYKTKTQLDNALQTFINFEKPKLAPQKAFSYIFPDIRMKVRMGIKLSSGVDLDLDDFETVLGSDDFGTVMGYETSEESEFLFTDDDSGISTPLFSDLSGASPPASVVAVAALTRERLELLDSLYDRGHINEEQYIAGRNQYEQAVEVRDEEGQFIGVRPREEIRAPIYEPRQPIGRPDLPEGGGEGSSRVPV